jgi:hypothetical protein
MSAGTVSPETTGFLSCRLLRLAGITVEVFLPASTRGRHRINAHRTHKNIHASSGIRTHDLSAGAGEDSSCLRPRAAAYEAGSLLRLASAKRLPIPAHVCWVVTTASALVSLLSYLNHVTDIICFMSEYQRALTVYFFVLHLVFSLDICVVNTA